MRKNGQLKGPLHGLPISVKDCLQIAGTQATIGFTAYLDQPPSEENSCLVDMLLDLGAVLYVKTNVPQTLMVCKFLNIYLALHYTTRSQYLAHLYLCLYLKHFHYVGLTPPDRRLGECHLRSNTKPLEHDAHSGRIQWRRGSTNSPTWVAVGDWH
jgi:hypothetical protein